MGTTTNGGRREYNTGSLSERAPGVWRMRIRTMDAAGLRCKGNARSKVIARPLSEHSGSFSTRQMRAPQLTVP